jgi:hypothetical protein
MLGRGWKRFEGPRPSVGEVMDDGVIVGGGTPWSYRAFCVLCEWWAWSVVGCVAVRETKFKFKNIQLN